MAQMDITIGIGRAIVKNILFTSSAGSSNLLIEISVLPFFENPWLPLGQIGAHRKVSFGQIQCCLVISWVAHIGLKLCSHCRLQTRL